MTNSFETWGPGPTDSELEQQTNAEELYEKIFQEMEEEASVAETLTNDFIAQEKKRLGITESDPSLESKIESIKGKYAAEKKSYKSRAFSLLKKTTTYSVGITATFLTTVGAIANLNKEDNPEYLSLYEKVKESQWDDATKQEIDKLCNDYVLLMKQDSAYKDIPESFFENRFMDFVKTYGADIQIIHPDDQKGLGNHMYEWTFRNLLRNPKTRAHYVRDVLFYGEKTIQKNEKGTYVDSTSSLSDFKAELSHHINKDWNLERESKYVDGLFENNFYQHGMYKDMLSSEYQAHDITEDVVNNYLTPKDHNFDTSFASLYNIQQEYYREFSKFEEYMDTAHIKSVIKDYLRQTKSFSEITKDKTVIFSNLERIKKTIDALVSSKYQLSKQELFGLLLDNCKLDNERLDIEDIATQLAMQNNIPISVEDNEMQGVVAMKPKEQEDISI